MDPPCVARENVSWRVRSCTNVSGLVLELMLRTIMEIRARPSSLAAMPPKGYVGHQFSDALEMYGPAVRCKGKRELESTVLHQCIRPRVGAYAPDHHGNPRAPELISGHASKGLCGSSVLGCAGKTISPSLVFLSQTSVGKTIVALTSRFS